MWRACEAQSGGKPSKNVKLENQGRKFKINTRNDDREETPISSATYFAYCLSDLAHLYLTRVRNSALFCAFDSDLEKALLWKRAGRVICMLPPSSDQAHCQLAMQSRPQSMSKSPEPTARTSSTAREGWEACSCGYSHAHL